MFAELRSTCRQSVTVEPRTTVDAYGNATYGAAVTYRVRVSGGRRLVINERGEEVYAQYAVYFADNPSIGPHDRLTLSTGDVGSTETGARQRPIVKLEVGPDELGRLHYAAYLA